MIQSRATGSTILYGLTTVAFLCFTGPLGREIPSLGGYWILGLFLALLLVIAASKMMRCNDRGAGSVYEQLIFHYALLLAIVSLLHYIGLARIPGAAVINAAGMEAVQALKQERAFALYYLLFPLMLLAQLQIQRVISLQTVIRIFAVAAFMTFAVALYQSVADTGFLHESLWSIRYEGLASDPNALALTCFLLLPMLIVGIGNEKGIAMKISFSLLTLMLVMALAVTGSRTGMAGLLLMLVIIPCVVAVSMRHWKSHWRLAMGMFPVMLLVVLFSFSSVLMLQLGKAGHTGTRLALTWHKFEQAGVQGLYFKQEARGKYLLTGTDLVREAPWGGWGPAGFYREATNMYFRSEGWKESWRGDFRDSAVNHYLMIAGDFGIPAALLNLGVVLLPLLLVLKGFRHIEAVSARFTVLLLSVSSMIFMLMIFAVPPSYFMGVCWVWTALLAQLFLAVQEHSASGWRLTARLRFRSAIWISSLLVMLLAAAGSYQTAFGEYGYATRVEHPWWKFNLRE